MLSFREAVKVGCDAIEMDVHETRDGRLVVIHDERLDRTTDGSGRVCDHYVRRAAAGQRRRAATRASTPPSTSRRSTSTASGPPASPSATTSRSRPTRSTTMTSSARSGRPSSATVWRRRSCSRRSTTFSLRKHPRDQRQRRRSRRARARGQHRRLPRLLLPAGGLRLLPPADRAAHGRKRARLQGARREDERLDRQRHGGSGAAPPLGLRGHHHELPRRGQRLAARAG